MDAALQAVLDFVEGRMPPKDFEQRVLNDPALQALLQDESLKWHATYIKSDPYYFLLEMDLDDPAGILTAQGAMELFLQRKNVPFERTTTYSDLHGLLLDAQPEWLDVPTAYLQTHVLPAVGDRRGKDLRKWLKVRLKELFRYEKSPPRWLQSPAWPIGDNGPFYFLGQLDLKDCEYFHDTAAVFVFLDSITGETRNVVQVM